jgi:hypothetical protein
MDVVNEVIVKGKNVLGWELFGPIHCKKNRLINVGWVRVADNGKKKMVAIAGGSSMYCRLGIGREGTGALQNMSDIVLPMIVGGGLVLGRSVRKRSHWNRCWFWRGVCMELQNIRKGGRGL